MDIESHIAPLAFDDAKQGTPWLLWWRRGLAFVIFAGVSVGLLIWWVHGSQWFSLNDVLALLDAHPVMAPVLFSGIYAIFVVLMIPNLPLSLAAGFLFGSLQGAVLATVGGVLGCVVSLLIARYGIAATVTRWARGSRMAKFQRMVARRGWLLVAIVRLNPIVPGLVNYLFGLTVIRLWTYTWSTAVFMFPLTFAVAVLGKAAGGVVLTPEAGTRLSLILLGSGAFSVFCLLALFGFWIQRRDF